MILTRGPAAVHLEHRAFYSLLQIIDQRQQANRMAYTERL